MNIEDQPELRMVAEIVENSIRTIEVEHHNLRIFSTGLLLAAAEIYSETHGSDELVRAFVSLVKSEEFLTRPIGHA